MDRSDVVIIGGGIAGLACGVALSDAGFRVAILESSDALGGRARSWTHAASGDRVDIGPHILLSEYRNMRVLLERLGTASKVLWPRRRFLTIADPPHAPVPIRVNRWPPPMHLLPSMLRTPQVSLGDILSNLRFMARVARLTPEAMGALDPRTAEDVLRADGVSKRYIDWFWRTAAMTVMNLPLEECSAASLAQLFRYLMGVGHYQVGLPRIPLGDLFVPGARQVIEAAGGEVRLGAAVDAVLVDDTRATGVRLRDGTTLRARWCIAALPPAELAGVLPPAVIARHRGLDGLTDTVPSAYVSTYLWFDRPLDTMRFWTRVWSPARFNYDFYDLSRIREDLQGRGSLIASNIIDAARLPPMDDAAIVEATLRELREVVPQARDVQPMHADVHRIPMAIPKPRPGRETRRPAVKTAVDGLLLAGDWLHTGLPSSMESAVRSAFLAADQVCAEAGRPHALAQPLPQVEGLFALVGRGRMP